MAPVSLSIDEEEFLTARRHHEHVYQLTWGSADQTALVNELQWDTFGERILHVEFLAVDLNVKAEVEVPLEFLGHPKGGMLNHLITKISLMAKPEQIPDLIEVKIEGLEEGHTIHAKDLILPDGIDLAGDPERIVANITAATAEEEPTEEEPEGEPSVVEVPTEG